jgi:hypothetical protein
MKAPFLGSWEREGDKSHLLRFYFYSKFLIVIGEEPHYHPRDGKRKAQVEWPGLFFLL